MMSRVRSGGRLILSVLCLTAAPGFAAGEVEHVAMKSIAFDPPQIRLHVGDTIEWRNGDIVAHTATAKDKSWDVSILPGKSGRMVMKTPGTMDYICRYHPNMRGEIVVEP